MIPLFMMNVCEFENYEKDHPEYLTEALKLQSAQSKKH